MLVTILALTFAGAAVIDSDVQKPRDLSKLDACKILTGADLTAATKRKVIRTAGGEKHCTYVLEAPKGGADTYDFFLVEASIVQALLSVKTSAEKGTPVPGLWTEAYIGPAVGSSQLSLIALQKGDMGMEIQGPDKDVLIGLGKLAASRLSKG